MSLSTLIILVYQVVAIAGIVHVVMNGRQPAKTMAWALVIYFVPIAGLVAYVFFGVNRRKERMISQRSLDQLTRRSMMGYVEQQYDQHVPDAQQPLVDLFINESFSLPFSQSQVELQKSGYEFFPSLLRDIAQAQSHIHIEMYIFLDDALGRLVSDALIAKARQGVEIRVIYDHVGSWSVKNSFFEHLREEGIEIEPFIPVRFPRLTSKANYRNHRKIIVIDGRVGYIGGMNIALRYVKGPEASKGKGVGEKSPIWRDTIVRVEGSAVYTLQRVFLTDWYFVDRTLLSDRKYYPENLTTADDPFPENLTTTDDQLLNDQTTQVSSLFQTVTSGPAAEYPEIMQGYLRIIMAARRYVYIETPYFLPTESVFFALKTAVASGVEVRVLVPRHCDAWFVEWASRSYLREAVESGIQVDLYEPGFLHSKLMVCDDQVCTCGSTNVDFRSFENNFEVNLFIYGEDEALRMKQLFLDDDAQSTPLTDLPERVNPAFFPRLGESLAHLFSPLL